MPLFSSLSESARLVLAGQAKKITFSAGDIVMNQGDSADALYIISKARATATLKAQRCACFGCRAS